MAAERVSTSRLRPLLWLRGKLMVRQFTRETGRIVGLIVALLIFGPLIASATLGTAVGYRQLPAQFPMALLGGVLVLLWLIWLVFPLIFSSINEGADVTRLLIYPLSRRDLVLGTLLGTLFDYPTYLMLPLFAAMVFGFGLGPMVLLGLLLAYAHMVIIGQLAVTAVGGILQSRRFRDAALVIFSLLASSCYFINLGLQSLSERFGGSLNEAQLMAWQPLNILQWLPTGAIARAIEQAQAGNWGTGLLWWLYSLAWLLLFTWLWLRLLYRLATGEGFLFGGGRQVEKKETAVRTPKAERNWLGWLPDDMAELIEKEFRSVWRIPQRRVGLVQMVILPFFLMGGFLFGGDGFDLPPTSGLFLPLYAVFMFWSTSQNMLAWEGRGLATLLLTPVPRWRIFYAKGFTLWVLAAVPFLVIGGVMLVLAPGWQVVAGIVTGLAAGLTTMAVTAVASVLFPMRMNLESRRMRGSLQTAGGCLPALASTFLVPIVIVIASAPLAIAPVLGWWLERPWLALVGLIFSVGYALLLFHFAAKFAGTLLLEREGQVMDALRQPEEQ